MSFAPTGRNSSVPRRRPANDLAIAVDGYTEFGGEFTDGSTRGVGTFSGSFTAEGSISGTLSFTTSANVQSSSTWSLGFDSLYDTASALSAIAGAYMESLPSGTAGTDPMQGASVTITGLGSVSGQGATSGCVLSGSLTVTDAKSDIYGITFKLSECTGDYAVLNAVPFAGLADLNPTSPAHMLIGASGQLSGTSYAMVLSLTAT